APLDYAAVAERARQMTDVILGPQAPAAPTRGPGVLGTLLQFLSEGVQAGLSPNVGEALAQQQQRKIFQQQRAKGLRREDQQSIEQLTGQIFSGELTAGRQEKAEQQREQRQAERDFQAYANRQREILGDQAFREHEAELTRIWQDKRDVERQKEI